ncbi:MAG: EF2563 family selenium-dependent molybdenum hydroxylase system protein [Deltaproteobacteria bacterium]|nr:EF2563 family selenium-dependent molybdenum hydroxylase system protein [Deltaproteobacteria bacterium]
MRPKVLIKGAGEHSSGTAHRFFRCGFPVVMTELEHPRAVRRTVSFCAAILHGETEVEGVRAVRYLLDDANMLADLDGSHIPVFVDPTCGVRGIWRPNVIIDGRILKYNLDNSVSDAQLVIGFGPGLVAGSDVHFVVETDRGHDLGRIIAEGMAAPDTGVPGDISGRSRERVVRAPAAGILRSEADIGDLVREGERLGTVDGVPVVSRLTGVLRGLVYPGSWVMEGQKIGDVDHRGARQNCFTLSDKTRTISGSALEIVLSFFGSA